MNVPFMATSGVTTFSGKSNGRNDIETRAEPKLVTACTRAEKKIIINEIMYCSGSIFIVPYYE